MTNSISWVDEVFETPALVDGNGNVMPRRGTIQFTGNALTVTDDPADDATVVAFGLALQTPGVLPIAVDPAAAVLSLSALQASYQALRFTGGGTACGVILPHPSTVDVNGASGGPIVLVNQTSAVLTFSVSGKTSQVAVPAGAAATCVYDANGIYLATTTAGP